jgi:hypothetical protein
MSSSKRIKENLDKRLEKIRKEIKEKSNKLVEKTQEKYNPVESEIKIKYVSQSCQDGSEHDWKKHHESEDHTEIVYYCNNCHIQKTEKQIFEHFKPKLLPHHMINHGPAERHHDPRKYSAPKTPVHLIGDIIQKNEIFNRCKNNQKIKSDVNNLEEKAKILSTIIPAIILDECVASLKLLEKIQESGYDVSFLGRGLPDKEIYNKVLEIKGILVTEDEEFHQNVYRDKFSTLPIFVSRNSELVMQNSEIINKAMRRFES